MLFDALWMGVPALTLADRPPVGRNGSSLMTNLRLTDWIAVDEESYIDKAVKFAGDFESLAQLRSSMRERMQQSPLRDEKGFAGDLEHAYRCLWKKWCAS